jgi:hypothetical protein
MLFIIALDRSVPNRTIITNILDGTQYLYGFHKGIMSVIYQIVEL